MLVAVLACACTAPAPVGGAPSPAVSPSPAVTVEPSPSPAPTPVSQQREAALPLARQEVAEGVEIGSTDSLWVIGGFDPERRSSASVQLLIGSGWTAGPAYPFPVDHAAAASAEQRLYVAGGYSNGVPHGDLYRIDASHTGWERLAPMHHPRGALALVSIGNHLYALGGAAGGEVVAVEAYDTVQNTWSDVASLPLPRDHGSGFSWLGLACMAGGRSPNSSRVDCLDPATKSWSRLPDLPSATSGAGAVAVAGQVVVAGGENASESTLVDRVFRFGGGTAWTSEPMLIPRHGVQLAVFAGRAWACGGATAAGYRATTDCTSIA